MSGAGDFDTDVLIVGMGPTGAALAGLLGQHGIRTAIFDQLPGLYPLPRAAGMDHEVMRVAQELGIADQLQPHVVPYRASEYRGVDGEVIKRLDSPPPPHRLGWDPMFAFDQPAFETLLRERVDSLPSVTVSLESTIIDTGQDDDHVWVDVRRAGATTVDHVTGRYLVGCDGGASPIRRRLGITMIDLGFHENFLVVDAIVGDDAVERLPATQVQYCEPDRPSTYVVLAGHHRRWEIMLEPGELAAGSVADDDAWPFIDRWIRPGEATLWRSAAYTFHGLVAESWRDGRILLAGDAAHMTPPFMAQGMAQGIRDAQNLAWKLRYAVDSPTVDASLLDSYQQERRPHVIETTGHAIDLGRVICERDQVAARQRDRELRGDTPDVPVTYRATFLPPLCDGLIATHTPGAGRILPQPRVTAPDGTSALLDDVIGSGFRVICAAPLEPSDADLLTEAIAPLGGNVTALSPRRGSPGGLRPLTETDDVLSTWLADLGQKFVIARPDHTVYATADSVADCCGLLSDLVAAIRGPRVSAE
ncbi:bifunctional 3-(3-hydroxy-phenyl)propionate/3-hydroxycinnamic acid hydroxylase [Gordonia sp. SL306]|uniref:bifunctional 3-(3-hydroxy-phenyl)propionate/3-hydroxycinnamic acid hydroxylase n=1 Tax=Gordonia sp. SL306 TaxID=2995145 RepID=UPI00226E3BBB|nr:bifunctional 3-(3-hydroxy-phenyl)propionate/3-hydroxycinnamic acid hydroxylase [Gordonia sp. SL306]WAC57564.1 bifunctional 3-(3-hydroxy-phenyl)propionate/3-hydroxycinnamic acid hydroxylase [Gordonia sp. SL306]